MSVTQKCNELVEAIKTSKEYKEYKACKEKVNNTPALREKVKKFEDIKYDEQVLTIQGEEQNPEQMEKLQELYKILVEDPVVKDYFDKQVKFNVMIADVNKAIGKAIEDVL